MTKSAAIAFVLTVFALPAAAQTEGVWVSPGKVIALPFEDFGWRLAPVIGAGPKRSERVLEIAFSDDPAVKCSVDENLTPPDVIMGADFSAVFWQSQHKLGITRDNPGDQRYRVMENAVQSAGGWMVHRIVTQDVDEKPVERSVVLTFAERTNEIGVIGIIGCEAPPARWGEVEKLLSALLINGAPLKTMKEFRSQ